uniref:Uncharacterized protein n=1 Tax=Globisporangium ultimum (strain ATCC 200006 / CBS 805.95 / DAOM BR144) TaxID=431595 RepID=K3WEZ3_GLOUD
MLTDFTETLMSQFSETKELTVGKTFNTASDSLHAAQDYALQENKSVEIETRSGMHRHIVCSSQGCGFFVRVYRKRRSDKTYGTWYISSINKEHTNCLSQPNPTQRQIVELPTFASAVRANGDIAVSALTNQIQSRDGISLVNKKRTLYRTREQAKGLDESEISFSYQKIPAYLAQLAKMNPGTVAFAEKDNASRFKRAIVVVKSVCRRILGASECYRC